MRYTRWLRQQASTQHFDPYHALTQVFQIPAGTRAGPLSDLSYVAKENICTVTGDTTCCSAILGAQTDAPYKSPFDATCIKLLQGDGALLLGKTNMDEFGMGSFTTNSSHGSTLNPCRSEYTAGGSSGGSAAALALSEIAGRRIDFALGTDTGGSVRTPAAYCGMYGFKPSYGRISRYGVVPYANSLDTVGILARKHGGLDMIRRVFTQLDQHDENDPTSLGRCARQTIQDTAANDDGTRPLRIGVPAEYNIAELDPAVLSTWKSSLLHLASQDCTLVPLSLPNTKSALAAYYILAPSEVSSNLAKYSGVFYGTRAEMDRPDGRLYADTRSLFGAEVQRRVLLGCFSLSANRFDNYYLQAQRIRRKIVHDFNRVFAMKHPIIPSRQDDANLDIDFIVTPTTTSSAPLLSDVAKMSPTETHAADVFTVPASMAGLPSISVPYGQDDNGMPIGIQVIGQFGDDYQVLDVAERLA